MIATRKGKPSPAIQKHIGRKVIYMGKIKDLKNQTFGYLQVVKYREKDKNNKALWECKCKCGQTKVARGSDLTTGKIKSCGCYKTEMIVNKTTKHKLSHSRIYCIYHNMLERCNNQNNSHYCYYGERGIKVCEEWSNKKDGFLSFYDWAIKNGYTDELTIDRINNNGDYDPNNCRWTDMKTQNRNKRSNRILTYNGENYIMKDLAQKLGIKYSTFAKKIRMEM